MYILYTDVYRDSQFGISIQALSEINRFPLDPNDNIVLMQIAVQIIPGG